MQHFLAFVDIAHTARNCTALGKNRVEEFTTQPRKRILHLNDECLCLIIRLHVGRGQPRELRLAFHNTKARILHIEDTAAVLLQNVQRRAAEIRRAVRRQFLTDCVQRIISCIRKDT